MKSILSLVLLSLSTIVLANPSPAINCNDIEVFPSDSLASVCVDSNDRVIGELYRYEDLDGNMKVFGDFNAVNMLYCPTNVRDYNAICRSLGGNFRSDVGLFYGAQNVDCEEKFLDKGSKHLQVCKRTQCIQNSQSRREKEDCRARFPVIK